MGSDLITTETQEHRIGLRGGVAAIALCLAACTSPYVPPDGKLSVEPFVARNPGEGHTAELARLLTAALRERAPEFVGPDVVLSGVITAVVTSVQPNGFGISADGYYATYDDSGMVRVARPMPDVGYDVRTLSGSYDSVPDEIRREFPQRPGEAIDRFAKGLAAAVIRDLNEWYVHR